MDESLVILLRFLIFTGTADGAACRSGGLIIVGTVRLLATGRGLDVVSFGFLGNFSAEVFQSKQCPHFSGFKYAKFGVG